MYIHIRPFFVETCMHALPDFFIQCFKERFNWIRVLVFSGRSNHSGHAKLGSLENRTDSWWNACEGSAFLKNQPFQCLFRG